ncbi:hypothetical protein SLH46_13305 [Draconibacterium sp. IB214405]|uniref:hypothetical protein n=1 Tax=Draconibacterium sp. IB214405 TaxID=3097352 RepID=UPI002A111AE2|nr:hypothetical protein [Draconibacterium sp. IB214405]MDX8340170.1 hypothetical protein [Draconibacterium sp. IB214405]
MKNLKFLTVFIFVFAFAATIYAQGNKFTVPFVMTWDENLAPIECIGQYSGLVTMNMTFFATGKVLNKASGTITDSEGNEYTIESSFNCHLFVRNISASGNSNQSWTYKVRSAENGKLVATVHMTFHYENFNGETEGASVVNVKSVCH